MIKKLKICRPLNNRSESVDPAEIKYELEEKAKIDDYKTKKARKLTKEERMESNWDDITAVRRSYCSYSEREIEIIKYRDSSVWVACPNFGWHDLGLGCKPQKKRCIWFIS